MKKNKIQNGQTLIETALILFLLLLILLGISEFARAWFVKNSIKNAARSGARVAVVTSGISNETRTRPANWNSATDCGSITVANDKVFCYIWNSPGVRPPGTTTTATLAIADSNGNGAADAGETISVSVVIANFKAIVPGLFRTFIPAQLSADASMRFEL